MPRAHTIYNFVTKAPGNSFTRPSDQLGKMAIFSHAINPVMIFLKLGDCVCASWCIRDHGALKCYEELAGSGARGVWNLAGEFAEQHQRKGGKTAARDLRLSLNCV